MEHLLDLILLNYGNLTKHNPINDNFFAIDLSISTPIIAPEISNSNVDNNFIIHKNDNDKSFNNNTYI